MVDTIIKYLDQHHIKFERDVDLKKRTWIHRGGVASLFIIPSDSNQLADIVKFLYQERLEFLLVGHTSNLYILNTANIPVVVSTLRCNKFELKGDRIYCEAGVGVIKLAKVMVAQGVKGFEYLTGLPGTIGAAICNNSSCKENSISKLLLSATVLTSDGEIITMYPNDFEFQFRTSIFKEKRIKGIILSATLKADFSNVAKLIETAKKNDKERAILLEGHSKNLGCTVNRCWSLGPMPILYRVHQTFFNVAMKLFGIDKIKRRLILKRQLFAISGFKDVEPYVSDKNPIVFMWLDENADKVFDRYLLFMEKVYRTNKIEIQIVR